MSLPSVTSAIIATAFAAWIVGLAALAAYRLYFSPIANFPGPKLAALSRWYEAYYEIVCNGHYSREIDRMHDIYGPIVRVAPNELHIRDSRFFDDVYTQNPKVRKHGWEDRFGSRTSVFSTSDSALHRRRRAALSPMFSRRAILNFEPIIRQHVEYLSKRLAEFQDRSRPLIVTHAFTALTGDIIMDYSFGFSYKHLESPEFSSFHEAFMAVGTSGHVGAQFPFFHSLMNSTPDSIVEKIQPALASLLRLRRDQWSLVTKAISGQKPADKSSHHTIFEEILQSRLPSEDKTQQHLADEAQTIIGAGVETTAFALCVGTFHIVNTPQIYNRLHKELVQAFPDRTATPDLMLLEKLPYLKACIQESLRLSYGLSARNPRMHDRPIQYKQWTIPARTVIAMTVVDVHHDEDIFPDSHSYIPERWLDDPKTSDGTSLEHYLLAFGKGPRSCLGINMAWTEMFLTMGTLFRRFKFDLYETDVSDVEMEHDFFIPQPKLDSKGVRLLVSAADDYD